MLTWRRFSNAVANGAALLLVTNEAYYALDVDFALQKRRVFARGTIGDCLVSRSAISRPGVSGSRVMFLAGRYVPVNNCGAPDGLTMGP